MRDNGAKRITDLPESAQQAARERIERLRDSLQLCDDYLSRYANADVNIGKTVDSMWLMGKAVEEAGKELLEHHGHRQVK